jgi:hypothetical protein
MLLVIVTEYIAVRYSMHIKKGPLSPGNGDAINVWSKIQYPRRTDARRRGSAMVLEESHSSL